nr:DMT family transporter [Desulforamulus aquiferis]
MKGQFTRLIVQGLLFFGCAYCYTSAIKYLAASMASIMLYAYPTIVVIITTFFLKEKIDLRKITALVLSFIGCLMVVNIVNDQLQLSWQGVMYGLGAALVYALYIINGQYLTSRLEPITISIYVMVVCSIATALVYPPMGLITSSLDLSAWLVGLGTAVLCSVIPAVFYLRGIAILGASKSAIVSTIEPAITIMLAFLILGERLTVLQLFGAFFIISGVIILQARKPPAKQAILTNR